MALDNQRLDYNALNQFRSSWLKGLLQTVFATIVKFLVAEGLASLEVACTDGTKLEAKANKYTFVWEKSIYIWLSKIADQINELWAYVESVCKQELHDHAPLTC